RDLGESEKRPGQLHFGGAHPALPDVFVLHRRAALAPFRDAIRLNHGAAIVSLRGCPAFFSGTRRTQMGPRLSRPSQRGAAAAPRSTFPGARPPLARRPLHRCGFAISALAALAKKREAHSARPRAETPC